MKIGVWLGYDIKESAGGAFSYIDRLIQLIDEHQFPMKIEICFVTLMGGGSFRKEVRSLIKTPPKLFNLLKTSPMVYRIIRGVAKRYIKRFGAKKRLEKIGIQVIYYIHQGECLDSNFPFIATNWDIGHRSTYAFPELMWDGKSYEIRENFYRNILPKALMVFCESKTGLEELTKYTNIGEHKLRILPMFGGSVTHQILSDEEGTSILNKYGLEKRKYYFYPAQFWAHKNHRNLVRAFAKAKEVCHELKLVLCGSDKGNKFYIENIVAECGVQNDVVFLGFVSIKELYCMYKYSTGLVMASYFGPTNMPPIEAMEIGCPVACSNLGGHHEILGDAAVYFDANDLGSMVDGLISLYINNDTYKRKIESQRSLSLYTEHNAIKTLENLLSEVVELRSSWL